MEADNNAEASPAGTSSTINLGHGLELRPQELRYGMLQKAAKFRQSWKNAP